MPTAQRSVDTGTIRGQRIVRSVAGEIRQARLRHGLSQAEVARAARISSGQMGRIERAENARVSVLALCRLLAILGMELNARAYPAGQPIRDAAHRALLDRLRARIGPGVRWRYERPIGGEGDLRAWDGAAEATDWRLGVEAETRVADLQELQRRIQLKLRDDPTTSGAILLLADTRHNRLVVRANREALGSDFPIDGTAALEAIGSGRLPGGSSVVLL
jgi:transcriptional regulator with XRE-family HTH domain